MATGFGVRYRSPIGPLRVDLGFKVNPRVLPSGSRERASVAAHLPGPGVLMVIGSSSSPSCSRRNRAEIIDRTLAIVSGPYRDAVRRPHGAGTGAGGRDAAVDLRMVQRLVDRELMLREAERYQPPEPLPSTGRGRDHGGRAPRWRGCGAGCGVLAAGGFTPERLRGWVRDDLRVAAYVQQRFPADDRRPDQIADWVSDLRRRAQITIFDP